VSSSSQCSVPDTHAAFPFCTATLKRCQRNDIDRESLVTAALRRPSSCKKRVTSSPTGPSVSMAIGMNWNSFDSAAYLSIFSCSAWLATCPGPVTAIRSGGWLRACQGSGHVKSQAKLWPRDQGIVVTPSGLLLSRWDSLAGSSREGISAESKLSRLITPLTAF